MDMETGDRWVATALSIGKVLEGNLGAPDAQVSKVCVCVCVCVCAYGLGCVLDGVLEGALDPPPPPQLLTQGGGGGFNLPPTPTPPPPTPRQMKEEYAKRGQVGRASR